MQLYFIFDDFFTENRTDPDGTTYVAASHQGLFCFPVSHEKYARLIWIKTKEESWKHVDNTPSCI